MNLEADLIKGTGGVFDVVADGELIFSKHQEDRYPSNDEIIGALRTKSGATS